MKAQVALFFKTSASGAAVLKSLRDVHASNTVVALYGLTCIGMRKANCAGVPNIFKFAGFEPFNDWGGGAVEPAA